MDDWSNEPLWSTPQSPRAWEVPAGARSQAPEPPLERPARRGVLTKAIAIGVVGGLLGLTSIAVVGRRGDHDASRASATTAPTTTSTTTSTTPPTSAPGSSAGRVDPEGVDAELLRRLGLRGSDVPADTAVRLLPGGNQVAGQKTLDLCDGTYQSEARRRARLQLVALADGTVETVSTEAVLYDAAAATAQAFAEIRREAARCPATTLRFADPPDSTWPRVAGVDRVAFDFVSNEAGGGDRRWLVAYLRRGRVLLGVYLPQSNPATVDGETDPGAIVRIFAERLAALPASIERP
ncbi:MAG: hypothetical protein JF603_04960 [Acidobacteria bacterium]|nr:hypothetical protein [Acidobacteriota bacterium]